MTSTVKTLTSTSTSTQTSRPTTTFEFSSTSTISSIFSTITTKKIDTTLPLFDFSVLNQTASITPMYKLIEVEGAAKTVLVSSISLKCSVSCSSAGCSLLTGYADWFANNSNSNFSKIYNSQLSFNSSTNEMFAIMPEAVWKVYLNHKVIWLIINFVSFIVRN